MGDGEKVGQQRIPAPVPAGRESCLDEVVDVREKVGRIVIEPVRQKVYESSTLLKGITLKNQHRAVDFGPAVGKECGDGASICA